MILKKLLITIAVFFADSNIIILIVPPESRYKSFFTKESYSHTARVEILINPLCTKSQNFYSDFWLLNFIIFPITHTPSSIALMISYKPT